MFLENKVKKLKQQTKATLDYLYSSVVQEKEKKIRINNNNDFMPVFAFSNYLNTLTVYHSGKQNHYDPLINFVFDQKKHWLITKYVNSYDNIKLQIYKNKKIKSVEQYNKLVLFVDMWMNNIIEQQYLTFGNIGRSDYHEHREKKIERYKELASKNYQEANQRSKRSSEILSHIPFGQPILADHYSAPRHRAAIKKSHNLMRSSIEADSKAKYYEDKIYSASSKSRISSDNPDAVQLLQDKLYKLEELDRKMKEINKHYRKHKNLDDFNKYPKMVKIAKENLEWQKQIYYSVPARTVPFENYNSTEIRRLKKRIASLLSVANISERQVSFASGYYLLNQEANRVQFIFDEKPSDEIRSLLKNNGFRWSPKNKAWQRLLNGHAIFTAKELLKSFKKLLE